MTARRSTPTPASTVHKETETMTGKKTVGRRVTSLLGALMAAAAIAVLAAPSMALAAPVLEVDSTHMLPTIATESNARYVVNVSNTGNEETTEPVNFEFSLPPGLKVASITDTFEELLGFGMLWGCTIAGDAQSVSCTGPEFFGSPIPIEPGKDACYEFFGIAPHCKLIIMVHSDEVLPPAGTSLSPTIEACDGGAVACGSTSDPIEVVSRDFELDSFDGEAVKSNGEAATQAGSHPYSASVEFHWKRVMDRAGFIWPIEDLDDAIVHLPPGLVGSPVAAPTCTEVQLLSSLDGGCAAESQVGTINLWFTSQQPGVPSSGQFGTPVYNMVAPFGTPAVFGFNVGGVATHIYASVRTGDDYGITTTTLNAPQSIPFDGVTFDFWGVPADAGHDEDRRGPGCTFPDGCASAEAAEPKPFLSLPTSCTGAVETILDVASWLLSEDSLSFLSHMPGEPGNTIGAVGCNTVDFSPTLEARPTTNVAGAPSGLDVSLHLPQNEDPEGSATAHLKDATVTLPPGFVINPSGANGLGNCSLAQFGYTGSEGDVIHTTPDPATCPDASKLGRVEVNSPLVDHPLKGSVYIADPYDNPFGSLLAIYVGIDDPQTGTVVKLAGEVTPDPGTGQLTTTFSESPQLPFEDFELHFFGGASGALRTPAVCGDHTATSTLVPWTAPEGAPANPSDTWQITQGPNGTACVNSDAARPHAPSFDAGAVSPIAGTYSPMVVNLRREDGSQTFSRVTVTPPPGLVGKLAGVPYCPDSALAAAAGKSGKDEQANPSCPAASGVGAVDVAAGAGPAPYWTQGSAYLTGPYKGAPIGLAIITPATAGPYDLGTVVTRVALHVNPVNAQITAVADPLPEILAGIPLDIRQALIRLDRPGFSLNPSSCDPMAFTGQLVSTLGQAAALSNRFQLGECDALGLKPRISMRLKGGTKRRGHPSLTTVLEPGAGNANLKSVSVALPPSALLDQSHIGTVCTRPQFAAATCPAASVYGTVSVQTPLLDFPLSGNVYLRSSNNKLPDLVTDLRGPAHQPIRLEAAGRTDTVKRALRNTFEAIPDAPFSKLTLTLFGGRKGLIQNSTNLCRKAQRATVKYTAHNGYTLQQKPKVKNACKKRKRKRRAKRSSHRRGLAVLQLRAAR